jgi:hypothetical protein
MKQRTALIVVALLLILAAAGGGIVFAGRLTEYESAWPVSLDLAALVCGVVLLAAAVWKK